MTAGEGAQANLDAATVEHFGEEWTRFPHHGGWGAERSLAEAFDAYFAPLPELALNDQAVVGDFGAGSGRWACFVAPLVKHLCVVEPSGAAMGVARANLAGRSNVTFVEEAIGGPTVPAGHLDVAYSLGVIHHVPDPIQALVDIRSTLKPGGLFLGYLYYALDGRPPWFQALWRLSDRVRSVVSRLPPRGKRVATEIPAAVVYWPLARLARVLGAIGLSTSLIPLRQYADKPYRVMRNDALDRFGTPLERRFTKSDISDILRQAGFDMSTLVFSPREPFWCFSIRNPL